MKKIVLILCVFLLVGCDKQISIEEENVQTISYDGVVLLKKEHKNMLDYFNRLKWKEGTLKEGIVNTLTITTKEQVYLVQITEKNHFIISNNKKNYYSKDASLIDFLNYLNKKKTQYLKEDFYQIDFLEEYQSGNNDLFIKLEQGNYFYLLVSGYTITDFRIHELERNEDDFEDVNVLYHKELIEKDHRIIIRVKNPYENFIRITFTTPYDYQVSIIPIYNVETGQFTYQKTMIPKENS